MQWLWYAGAALVAVVGFVVGIGPTEDPVEGADALADFAIDRPTFPENPEPRDVRDYLFKLTRKASSYVMHGTVFRAVHLQLRLSRRSYIYVHGINLDHEDNAMYLTHVDDRTLAVHLPYKEIQGVALVLAEDRTYEDHNTPQS